MKTKTSISSLFKTAKYHQCIHYSTLNLSEITFNTLTMFSSLLSQCIDRKYFTGVKNVQAQMLKSGFPVLVSGGKLIDASLKCGNFDYARELFDEMPERNIVTWNSMIASCISRKMNNEAIGIYNMMGFGNIFPNEYTFSSIFKAFSQLGLEHQGRSAHGFAVVLGLEVSVYVGSALVDMYSKFGKMRDARLVLDRVVEKNVVLFNALIIGHSNQREDSEALEVFRCMTNQGINCNDYTFASILRVCGNLEHLRNGKMIHGLILKSGLEFAVSSQTSLLRMYSKSGLVEDSLKIFEGLDYPDEVTWASLIAGLVENGREEIAWSMFRKMICSSIKPNSLAFSSVLRGFSTLAMLDEGKQIHAIVTKYGLDRERYTGVALIDLYGKCGSSELARFVFDSLIDIDLISMNAMICSYAQNGYGNEALQLFGQMEKMGLEPNEMGFRNIFPDKFTFSSIFKAFSQLGLEHHGRSAHRFAVVLGLEVSVNVGSALVDMYLKFGRTRDARLVLDRVVVKNEVLYNALIVGHSKQGEDSEALEVFRCMTNQGISASDYTFASILMVCGNLEHLRNGKLIHGLIIKSGLEVAVSSQTSLLRMYSKSGLVEDSLKVFEGLDYPDEVTWASLIAGLVQNGREEIAWSMFRKMICSSIKPQSFTFSSILRGCSTLAMLDEGKQIHAIVTKYGLDRERYTGVALIDLYGKCGSSELATLVFNSLIDIDLISMNAMIYSYAQNGYGNEALQLFSKMEKMGLDEMGFRNIFPDECTFSSIFKAFSQLGLEHQGRTAHGLMVILGLEVSVYGGSALVDMYSKFGKMRDARLVFDRVVEKDVLLFNALIVGHSKRGEDSEVLEVFCCMTNQGISASDYTFGSILITCGNLEHLTNGKLIHGLLIKLCLEVAVSSQASLIRMYSKTGLIEDSLKIFEGLDYPDEVTWASLIAALVQNGREEIAWLKFRKMICSAIKPNSFTFSSVLRGCSTLAMLDEGKQIHAIVTKYGLDRERYTGVALIDLYGKCGSSELATFVFNSLIDIDLISMNAMIYSYAQNGYGNEALQLFSKMEKMGLDEMGFRNIFPDECTFSSIFKAFSQLGLEHQGRTAHGLMVILGLEVSVYGGSALVDMYSKFGKMRDARLVFDRVVEKDVLLFNALIVGHSKQGEDSEVLEVFRCMTNQGISASDYTFGSILITCGNLEHLTNGKLIHGLLIKLCLEVAVSSQASLIRMYSKTGLIEDSLKIFEGLDYPDEVTWAYLIAALVQNGREEIAWLKFRKMICSAIKPNSFTFSSVLRGCSTLAMLDEGKQIHAIVTKYGLDRERYTGVALIDLYGKCGSSELATFVFNSLIDIDLISMNAMIYSYAQNGYGNEALQLFSNMEKMGLEPNDVTILSVLLACNNSGLVDEGCELFTAIKRSRKTSLTTDHYACMVCLLGRCGRLEEAEMLIDEVKEPDLDLWRTLLSACRIRQNVEMAERIMHRILKIAPGDGAAHVLLSNLYASTGKWNSVIEIRSAMREMNLKKKNPAMSWVDVNRQVHTFMAGD